MLPVEPLRDGDGDEELRPVGVGPGVGHGEEPGGVVAEDEVLVGEGPPVDGLAAGAVVVREVAALPAGGSKTYFCPQVFPNLSFPKFIFFIP